MRGRRRFMGGNKLPKGWYTMDEIGPSMPEGWYVYIYTTSEYLVAFADWDVKYKDYAIGVAIRSDDKFGKPPMVIMGKDYPNGDALYREWSTSASLISGIFTTSSDISAATDFKGVINTDKIIEKLGNQAIAASICRNVRLPNGKKGYLGSAGELSYMMNVGGIGSVNNILNKAGGDILNGNIWTSTQTDNLNAWGYQGINMAYPTKGFGMSKTQKSAVLRYFIPYY